MDDQYRLLTDALLERLPLGVIVLDLAGQMVYVNQTAERIRNVRRQALLGRSVLLCHAEKSRAHVQRALENIQRKPETVYRRMVEDSANGKYYTNTYAGILDAQEQTIGIAVLTEDVTEKRRLELERATNYQMMQETSNSLRVKYHELLMASLETISKILETRDPYTCNHSRNVCDYALRMYELRYGVGSDYHTLKTAATLHDIGKIGVPDSILRKCGALTADEYAVIQRHSVIAEEILRPLDSGTEISNIVRHHHERFDGSGYPDHLQGEQIPQGARIIAVADAFDAMHSDRPYRAALPFERCVDEIAAGAGTQFDPEWAQVFVELASTGSI